jgi:hypothetical protein
MPTSSDYFALVSWSPLLDRHLDVVIKTKLGGEGFEPPTLSV